MKGEKTLKLRTQYRGRGEEETKGKDLETASYQTPGNLRGEKRKRRLNRIYLEREEKKENWE